MKNYFEPERSLRLRQRAGRLLAAWLLAGSSFALRARQTPDKSSPPDKIPPLRPPRSLIGPDYWEVHRSEYFLGAAALLAVIVISIWWLRRSRQPEVIPPALAARRNLDALQGQPEEGALLSRVSQVLKYYLVGAMKLPVSEMTTSEISQAIQSDKVLDPRTAGDFIEFFKQSDRQKFSPSLPPSGSATGGVVDCALGLIGRAEESFTAAAAAEKDSAAGTGARPAT